MSTSVSPSDGSPLQEIFVVKWITGKTMTFNVRMTDTVLSLKEKYLEKEGILLELQRYVFNGKRMEDDKTLEEYGIKEGSTIFNVRLQPPFC